MTQSDTGTVLVTGGRGFIGRAVGKLLQRQGYRVVSLDRAGPSDVPEGPQEVVADICDREELERLFRNERVRGVVHLAATLPTAAQREPELATRVKVQGSVNLLELAREFRVRRFVFGSSLSIYGTWPADHAVTEADRAAPEDVYGAAKLCIERCGAAYRELYGLEFVSLRIGRVVAPGAQSRTSPWRSQIFESLGTLDPVVIDVPYAESERVLLVHVEDVAEMLVRLLHAERTQHSTYNACCESVVVGALAHMIEGLNSNVQVNLGGAEVLGNPRALDCSRFRIEFGFETVPIFDRRKKTADKVAGRVM